MVVQEHYYSLLVHSLVTYCLFSGLTHILIWNTEHLVSVSTIFGIIFFIRKMMFYDSVGLCCVRRD